MKNAINTLKEITLEELTAWIKKESTYHLEL